MSQKFSLFFLTKLKKMETKNDFVLSCSFDPIKIRTRLAPQNVHKNLSFVKDTNVVCQNMTRKCCKIVQKPICALHFRYVFISVLHTTKIKTIQALNFSNLYLLFLLALVRFQCRSREKFPFGYQFVLHTNQHPLFVSK